MIALNESSSRRVFVIFATALLCGGSVLADERAGNAQIQARQLLSGTTAAPTSVFLGSSGHQNERAARATTGASEQARGLLLGTPGFGAGLQEAAALASKATSRKPIAGRQEGRVSPDVQAMARRLILGAPQNQEGFIARHHLVDR